MECDDDDYVLYANKPRKKEKTYRFSSYSISKEATILVDDVSPRALVEFDRGIRKEK